MKKYKFFIRYVFGGLSSYTDLNDLPSVVEAHYYVIKDGFILFFTETPMTNGMDVKVENKFSLRSDTVLTITREDI